jgi:hypothetical protein
MAMEQISGKCVTMYCHYHKYLYLQQKIAHLCIKVAPLLLLLLNLNPENSFFLKIHMHDFLQFIQAKANPVSAS